LNELTTSGAVPARIAATILLSLIEPTTLTVTFGLFLSYSATTCLKTPSSRALQPTQIVSFVGAAGAAFEPAASSPRPRRRRRGRPPNAFVSSFPPNRSG
jgi:hypothetical protein